MLTYIITALVRQASWHEYEPLSVAATDDSDLADTLAASLQAFHEGVMKSYRVAHRGRDKPSNNLFNPDDKQSMMNIIVETGLGYPDLVSSYVRMYDLYNFGKYSPPDLHSWDSTKYFFKVVEVIKFTKD